VTPSRRLSTPLVSLALVALGAAACSGGSDTAGSGSSVAPSSAAPSSAGSVTIAVGGPYSGSEKGTGDQIQAGAKLAVDQINKAGGITAGPRKGAMLELKPFDDADDPAKSASTVRDMISDSSIVGFVGSGLSDGAIAAAPIASRANFPYLSAYASSEKILAAATGSKSVFVVAPTFPAYAISVTDELIAAGRKRVAVLHLMGTYGEGIAKYVDSRLKEAGLTPVSESTFTFTDTDFRTQLAKAKAAKPDALVMVGLPDSDASILKQASMLGLKVPAYDPGGITNSDTFLKNAGALAEGVVGNSPSDIQRNTPAATALRTDYKTATGESVVPDPAAFAYEGVEAIASAFADGATGRDDLAAHLHAIKIDDTGVGPLSFAADGSRIGGILYVFTIKNGVPVFTAGYQQTDPTAVTKVALQH
jgi:branched-chain amino acid transport system substrate-binding protein